MTTRKNLTRIKHRADSLAASRPAPCSDCNMRRCCCKKKDICAEPECELDPCITEQIQQDIETAVNEIDIFVPSIDCNDIEGGVEILVTKKDEDGEIRVYTKTLLNGQNGNDGDDGQAPELEPFLCEQTTDGSLVITVPGYPAKVLPAGTQGPQGEVGPAGNDSLANIECEEDDNGDILINVTNIDGDTECKKIRQGIDGQDSLADINCTEVEEGFAIAITDGNGSTVQKLLQHGVDGEDGADSQANIECENIQGGVELTITDGDGNTNQKIIRDGERGEDGADSLANIECENLIGGVRLTVTDADGATTQKDVLNGEDGEDGVCLANIECETNQDGDYLFTITDQNGIPTTKLVRNGRDGNDGISPVIDCVQLPDGSVSIAVNGGAPKILLAGEAGQDGEDGANGISPTIDCVEGEGFLTLCINNADGTKTLKTLTAPTTTGTQTPVQSVDVDAVCNDGDLAIDVTVDGVTGSTNVDLSKLQSEETPVTQFCMSYDSATVFQAVNNKVTIPLDLKVDQWNGGFQHVGYDSQAQCLEIPYVGPSKDDINQCIALALAGLDTGDGGLSQAQIKTIVEACIALLPTAPSYCLSSAAVSQVGSQITITLNQENCPTPVQFSFNVGDQGSVECCNTGLTTVLGANGILTTSVTQSNGATVTDTVDLSGLGGDASTECCNTGLNVAQSGDNYTVSVTQSNGATVSDTFVVNHPTYCMTGITQTQIGQVVTLEFAQDNCPAQQVSFTVGDAGNGSVECCNTNNTLTASVNIANKTVDFSSTIAQSVGANVVSNTSISIQALANAMLDIETLTDADGCSQYQQMTLCGLPFGERIPVFQPAEQCCQKFCPPAGGFTGQQTYQAEFETVVTWSEGVTETIPANTTAVFDFTTPSFDPILICFADPCLTPEQTLYSTFTSSPTLNCC